MLRLVPASRDTCPFRQQLLEDPATMAYNAPWYPPDGCIPFPESAWDAWLARWAHAEPEHFCGYLYDGDVPVGEVSWHHHGEGMGIVILAAHRGKGYAREGLQLLIERAFSHREVQHLCNDFEQSRHAALHVHQALGFRVINRQDGFVQLELRRP